MTHSQVFKGLRFFLYSTVFTVGVSTCCVPSVKAEDFTVTVTPDDGSAPSNSFSDAIYQYNSAGADKSIGFGINPLQLSGNMPPIAPGNNALTLTVNGNQVVSPPIMEIAGGSYNIFSIYNGTLILNHLKLTGTSPTNVNLTPANVAAVVNLIANNTRFSRIQGSGTFTVNAVDGPVIFDVAAVTAPLLPPPYSGATVVQNGILRAGPSSGSGVENVFSPNSAVTVAAGATLDLNGRNQSIASLQGYGTVEAGSSSAVLSLMGNLNAGSFAGVMNGGILKLDTNATGVLDFVGTRSEVGGTYLNGGALKLYTGSSATSAVGNSLIKFNGGTLVVGGVAETRSFSNLIQLEGQGVFNIENSVTASFSNSISGSGRIIKQGPGSLIFSGARSDNSTGDIYIADGSLEGFAGNGDGTGGTTRGNLTGDIWVDGVSSSVIFNQKVDATYSKAITGAGGLKIKGTYGPFALFLTGVNNYQGDTTFQSSSVSVSNANQLGDGTGVFIFDGGTLVPTQDLSFNNAITLAAGGGSVSVGAGQTTTLSGVVSGAGALEKSGDGALQLTNNDNTNSGGFRVTGGSLLGNSSSIKGNIATAAGTSVVFSQPTDGVYSGHLSGAGQLTKLGGYVLTLLGANGGFTGNVNIGAGTLDVNIENGQNYSWSGSISGGGILKKSNAGTLILNNLPSNTGGILASAGILNFNLAAAGTYAENITASSQVFSTGAQLTFIGSNTFTGSSTSGAGGAYNTSTKALFSGSGTHVFKNNKVTGAGVRGGGFFSAGNAEFSGAVSMQFGGSGTGEGNTSTGTSNPTGGGFSSAQNVIFSGTSRSSFINNMAAGNGGGFDCNGSVTIQDSSTQTFISNSGAVGGGFIAFGTATFSGSGSSTFKSNTATTNGGGFYANSNASISGAGDINFTNNKGAYGGGFYTSQSAILGGAGNYTFTGNVANAINYSTPGGIPTTSENGSGGAIYAQQNVKFSGGGSWTFIDNRAPFGGAIYFRGDGDYTDADLGNVISNIWQGTGNYYFTNNRAESTYLTLNTPPTPLPPAPSSRGGAVYALRNLTLANSANYTFTNNYASIIGAALYLNQSANFKGTGSYQFINNTAVNGGGAFYTFGTVLFSGTGTYRFQGNTSKSYGGAIYSRDSVTFTNIGDHNLIFSNNVAQIQGGAINMIPSAAGKFLTFVTSQDLTFNPSTLLPTGYTGSNDISSANSDVTLRKQGSANLILNTQNPGWLGPVSVEKGALIVGNSSANRQASLGPTGQALTVSSGAAVGGFGTVSVQNATFNDSSILVAGVGGSNQSGLLNAANTISVGKNAMVRLNADPANPPSYNVGDSYTIASANTIVPMNGSNGKFLDTLDPQSTLGGFLTFQLVQNGKTVVATILKNSLNDQVTSAPQSVTQSAVAATTNHVFANLDTARESLEGIEGIDTTFAQKGQVRKILNRSSRYGIPMMGQQSNRPPVETILSAIEQVGPITKQKGSHVFWISGLHNFGDNKKNSMAPASQDSHDSLAVGMEFLNKKLQQVIGIVATGGLGSSFAKDARDNNGKHKTLQAGVYHSIGLYQQLQWDSMLIYTLNRSLNQRVVSPSGGGQLFAHSRSRLHNLSFSNQFSYKFRFKDHFSLKPSYTYNIWQSIRPGYGETDVDKSLALSYAGLRISGQEHQLGVSAKKVFITPGYNYAIGGEGFFSRSNNPAAYKDKVYTNGGAGSALPINIPTSGRTTMTGGINFSRQHTATNHRLKFSYSVSRQKYRTSQELLLKSSWLF